MENKFDYSKQIVVGNYKHRIKLQILYPATTTIYFYIGRENIYYNLPYSILANPFYISEKEKKDPVKTRECLDKFRLHLFQHLQKKGDIYNLLQEIINKYLAEGKTVLFLCWCKTLDGQGYCHGDIIKNAILWLVKENINI